MRESTEFSMCADTSTDIKLDWEAPLIAYPPLGNSPRFLPGPAKPAVTFESMMPFKTLHDLECTQTNDH